MGLIQASGWEAVFTTEHDGKKYKTTREVVFWREDEGRIAGLVADDSGRGFRDAMSYSNFTSYQEMEQHAHVFPAQPGWWVVGKGNDGDAWWERIIAWTTQRDGWDVVAITAPDSIGYSEPTPASKTIQYVYDPERTDNAGPWPFPERDTLSSVEE